MTDHALGVIRERLSERQRQIDALTPQIQRGEQFCADLRGKLFQAQAQLVELTELAKALDNDVTVKDA